jgi:hypothetical protein
LAEKVEAAARIVADAHNVTIKTLLTRPEVFFSITAGRPTLAVMSVEDGPDTYAEYEGARSFLSHHWMKLEPTTRAMTLEYIEMDDEPDAEENGNE